MTKTAAAEEANLQLATALADKSTALRSEVRLKAAAVRKFLGNARDGIASVRKGITDTVVEVERLLVALSPLEDSITALQLAQHQHSLQVFTQHQEVLLAAEAQRHQ